MPGAGLVRPSLAGSGRQSRSSVCSLERACGERGEVSGETILANVFLPESRLLGDVDDLSWWGCFEVSVMPLGKAELGSGAGNVPGGGLLSLKEEAHRGPMKAWSVPEGLRPPQTGTGRGLVSPSQTDHLSGKGGSEVRSW